MYRSETCQERLRCVELGPSAASRPFTSYFAPGEAVKYRRRHPFGFVVDADPSAGKDRSLTYLDAQDQETLKKWLDALARSVPRSGPEQITCKSCSGSGTDFLGQPCACGATGRVVVESAADPALSISIVRPEMDGARHHALLVFCRHGESQWNVDNRFTGWVDVDLSERGKREAKQAGELIMGEGLRFDVCYSSVLRRALKTCDIALEESDQLHVPVNKCWRLNERMYGALTGLDKKETALEHGEEKVQIWRRSFDVPPPAIADDSEFHPSRDPKYAELPETDIPLTECLKDTVARVMPYWEQEITPQLVVGRTVFIAAHGNSIRAIIKVLEAMPDDEICKLEIPTATPLVYALDASLKPKPSDKAVYPLRCGRYLGDAKKIASAAEAVQNQARVA